MSSIFNISTYLSPGQRFKSSDVVSSELTVARLVKDRFGLLHVTLRSSDGREVSAFVEQVEAAIADGHLTPVHPGATLAGASLSAC